MFLLAIALFATGCGGRVLARTDRVRAQRDPEFLAAVRAAIADAPAASGSASGR
jgi:hypothetical protein